MMMNRRLRVRPIALCVGTIAAFAIVGTSAGVRAERGLHGLTGNPAPPSPGEGAWHLEYVPRPDGGDQGARWPAMASGSVIVFADDADYVTALDPPPVPNPVAAVGPQGNSDHNSEVWAWSAAGLHQLTSAKAWPEGGPSPAWLSVSMDSSAQPGGPVSWNHIHHRVAFVADANLRGRNRFRKAELWTLDWVDIVKLSASVAGIAGGASIAPDGRYMVLWYAGDPPCRGRDDADPKCMTNGHDSDWSLELFVIRLNRPSNVPDGMWQASTIRGAPDHDPVVSTANGGQAAFVVGADLTGENHDRSRELFFLNGSRVLGCPGSPSNYHQITHAMPVPDGREIEHPSISADGGVVAFVGRGQIDGPDGPAHDESEIYIWRARTGVIERITHATSPGASSSLPELSDDGTHLVFVSTADLAPAAPGNADGSPELFVWSECGAITQLTSGNQAVGSLPTDPSLAPTINSAGTVVAFVSGSIDSPYPLETTDGKGYLFRAIEDPASACVAVGTPTPTPWAPWLPTPTPSSGELGPEVCPQIVGRVPAAEIARTVSAPEHVSGWLAPTNPALPIGPFNPPRHWLSMRDLGKPFGPANPLIWKAGCP